ncbi:hypothetical protein GCM10027346_38260 [Hymenobacter seoulensis]
MLFEYSPGPRVLSDLQALLTHTSVLLRRNNWNKLLGDQRQMSPYTPEESAWIVDYWLDSSRQRPEGIYGAVLLAQDVFARLTMSQVMGEAKASTLTYRVFDQEEDAVEWLKQLS